LWFTISYDYSSSSARVALFDHSGNMLGQVETSAVEAEPAVLCGAENNNNDNRTAEIVLLAPPPISPLHKTATETESAAAFVVAHDGNAASSSSTTAAAFVHRPTTELPSPHADVSFIIVHDQMVDLDYVRDLRKQARRYDVNL
jgi:hypothetical protein